MCQGLNPGWGVTEMNTGKVHNTSLLDMVRIISALEKILYSAFEKQNHVLL